MFHFNFDEFMIFRGVLFCRGWCFHESLGKIDIFLIDPEDKEQQIPYIPLNSHDIQLQYGDQYENCRFDFSYQFGNFSREALSKVKVIFRCEEEQFLVEQPALNVRSMGPLHECSRLYFEKINEVQSGRVLEIGSRARSGNVYRGLFPDKIEYVGLDIMDGPNVDVVGDAHRLSDYFPNEYFDFLYSISTFEHLLMPWIVAVEMNKIMKTGGYAYLQSHQTWPLHELPWDFYRFSNYSWQGLFNKFTGFEVVSTAYAHPCISVPCYFDKSSTYEIEYQEGYLVSFCLIKKTAESQVNWSVNPREITDLDYSH